jgi:hypothetical protein
MARNSSFVRFAVSPHVERASAAGNNTGGGSRAEGLGDVVVDAGASPDTRASSPARESMSTGTAAMRIGSNGPQELEAIEVGHHYVGDDQIGKRRPYALQSGGAVDRRLYIPPLSRWLR